MAMGEDGLVDWIGKAIFTSEVLALQV